MEIVSSSSYDLSEAYAPCSAATRAASLACDLIRDRSASFPKLLGLETDGLVNGLGLLCSGLSVAA